MVVVAAQQKTIVVPQALIAMARAAAKQQLTNRVGQLPQRQHPQLQLRHQMQRHGATKSVRPTRATHAAMRQIVETLPMANSFAGLRRIRDRFLRSFRLVQA